LVDIVDELDRVVRTATRSEMRLERLRHRGVFVAVLTTNGQLVIHQRSPFKDVWPSRWDICAGGVVAAGETYERAAERELFEELGVNAPLKPIGNGYYEDDDVALFGHGFVARNNGPYAFNDGEVVAVETVTLGQLETLLPQRTWCTDSIQMALPLLRAHMLNA
jgi:8-oxo-dGTP pyrophosphatase MutT (NUDIX family)